MKKLTMTLAVAALGLGTMAMTANAQTQSLGAASFHAQLKNATPIIKHVDCQGGTGVYGCGAGWYWNGRQCVRCY